MVINCGNNSSINFTYFIRNISDHNKQFGGNKNKDIASVDVPILYQHNIKFNYQ